MPGELCTVGLPSDGLIELELRCGLPVEAGIFLGDGYLAEWMDS